jgi:hypothetical protein
LGLQRTKLRPALRLAACVRANGAETAHGSGIIVVVMADQQALRQARNAARIERQRTRLKR